MTYVSNQSANVASYEAVCDSTGAIVSNSSLNAELPLQQHNFMVTAKGPAGPWSAPVAIDKPLDDAVAPFPGFTKAARPNRNTNIVLAIQPDGSMVGLWRRCCKESTDPKLQPAGGGGVSSTPPSKRTMSRPSPRSRAIYSRYKSQASLPAGEHHLQRSRDELERRIHVEGEQPATLPGAQGERL